MGCPKEHWGGDCRNLQSFGKFHPIFFHWAVVGAQGQGNEVAHYDGKPTHASSTALTQTHIWQMWAFCPPQNTSRVSSITSGPYNLWLVKLHDQPVIYGVALEELQTQLGIKELADTNNRLLICKQLWGSQFVLEWAICNFFYDEISVDWLCIWKEVFSV